MVKKHGLLASFAVGQKYGAGKSSLRVVLKHAS